MSTSQRSRLLPGERAAIPDTSSPACVPRSDQRQHCEGSDGGQPAPQRRPHVHLLRHLCGAVCGVSTVLTPTAHLQTDAGSSEHPAQCYPQQRSQESSPGSWMYPHPRASRSQTWQPLESPWEVLKTTETGIHPRS